MPPIGIKVSEIECGDDLRAGILAVDGARFLLSKLKNDLKGIIVLRHENPTGNIGKSLERLSQESFAVLPKHARRSTCRLRYQQGKTYIRR